jgi:protein arginine N-methyltransferase 2
MNDKPYIQQRLTYTDDGRLLDEYGNAVMMEWERPIMKKSAEVVCRKGGRILNVGFGMGIIDSYIEKYDIEEHWIIEPHLDVYTKMFNDGWHLNPKVRIMYGDWQWYLKYMPKFDGIYADTWQEEIHGLQEYVPNILKDDGVFSFFNNPRGDEKELHMMETDYEICNKWGRIEYETIQLDFVDDVNKQTDRGLFYWHPTWKTYYCPVITKK